MTDAPAPVTEPVALPTDSETALRMAAHIIRQFEGFSAKPYRDQAGVWTIGYGTIRLNGQPVTADTPPVAMDEADAAMMSELQPTAAGVDASIHDYATVGQRAALYSFAYNEGPAAERSSSALRLFNDGDITGAADALLLWNKVRDPATKELVVSNGLVRRRAFERAVFLGLVVP